MKINGIWTSCSIETASLFEGDDFVITEMSAPLLKENCQFNLYLAEDCAGRVLIILRKYDYITCPETYEVMVFKLVGGNREETEWKRVKSTHKKQFLWVLIPQFHLQKRIYMEK